MKSLFKGAMLAILSVGALSVSAQFSEIQYFRPYDKLGLNTFETSKVDTVPYTGQKVRIGAGFTQGFQTLKSSNNALPKVVNNVDQNKLVSLTPGFNYALANLNFDFQLADGVLLNLTMYLSSRHHEETWVKSGYIQFDKVPFFNSDLLNALMNYTTIKVGHMEVDYGDAHFRRSDNGNTIWNPFAENYILDAFATEIAAEAFFHYKVFLGVAGLSNGLIHGDVIEAKWPNGDKLKKNPSFYGKIGYDGYLADSWRLRLTQSAYYNGGTTANTLFSGDRSGSQYWGVMEYSTDFVANKGSGRWTPGFGHRVTALMTNLFTKYNGLEFFGTMEFANGSTLGTDRRHVRQFAGDLLYYFGQKQNFYLGARYNTLRGELATYAMDANIDRWVLGGGYFFTKNLMVKAEYVNQKYKGFPQTSIYSGGKFDGFVFEAVVGL